MAKIAPSVSTSPRAVVSTVWIWSAIGPDTWGGQAATIRRATSSARLREPMKPAMAVTRIRNGNIAIRSDSAIWLAIAQPSSALKRKNASMGMRRKVWIERNGSGLRRMSEGDVMEVTGAAKLQRFRRPGLLSRGLGATPQGGRRQGGRSHARRGRAAGAITQTAKRAFAILS